jgi:6-phosphogluconate dehydrogenase
MNRNKQKKFFGLIGLGVMGQNLALNIERKGFTVAGLDRDEEVINQCKKKFKNKNISVYSSLNLETFLQDLESPKKIMMMIPENGIGELIRDLIPFISEGDLLIDGGNSYFLDTERRYEELQNKNILYIGTGVSGGEAGALRGPSIMPGGNKDAWPLVKNIFQEIAAKVNGTPCCEWLGSGGVGHFVKMIHNGIEYADMQMICEAYFLMEQALGLNPKEISKVFSGWNKGELNSYLIEITGSIMAKDDDETGKPMIHIILDAARHKGTGKWASKVALDMEIPAQTIAEAVFARFISAMKDQRVQAAKQLPGPGIKFNDNKEKFIEMIRKALYASKICSYAQGYQLMQSASEKYNWNLNIGKIALLWRGGCIIRAQFLEKIEEAYDGQPDLLNLLLDPYFKNVINANQAAWRKVVAKAVELGIPVPALSSALAYYDSYRSYRLPANLIQAMRDYFGAHNYERVDKPGQSFHTKWS